MCKYNHFIFVKHFIASKSYNLWNTILRDDINTQSHTTFQWQKNSSFLTRTLVHFQFYQYYIVSLDTGDTLKMHGEKNKNTKKSMN